MFEGRHASIGRLTCVGLGHAHEELKRVIYIFGIVKEGAVRISVDLLID